MAETVGTALKTGLGTYVGLGVALLVGVAVLGPLVTEVAVDADLPTDLTDAQLVMTLYPAILTAVALLAGVSTGMDHGRRNPDETGPAVGRALLVTVIGVAILVVLGYIGLLAGIELSDSGKDVVNLTVDSLAISFLVLLPAAVTSIVSAVVSSKFYLDTGYAAAGRRPRPGRQEARGRGAPTGGGRPARGGPGGGGAPAATGEAAGGTIKRLKCPSCTHVFRTAVRGGRSITCPECGYASPATA